MAESSWVHERSGARFGSLFTMLSAAIDPWKSSDTVGMRTARPADALSVQLGLIAKARAALGETKVSSREANRSVAAAIGDVATLRLPAFHARAERRLPAIGEVETVLHVQAGQARVAAKGREARAGVIAQPVGDREHLAAQVVPVVLHAEFQQVRAIVRAVPSRAQMQRAPARAVEVGEPPGAASRARRVAATVVDRD